MPTMPWTVTGPVEPDQAYIVMATRFTLAHRFRMGSVASATRQLWSAIAAADGLTGYSLRADLVRGTLATLSVWRDDAALSAFVRGEQHSAVVTKTRRWMRASTFASWEASSTEFPPNWDEADSRLDAAP